MEKTYRKKNISTYGLDLSSSSGTGTGTGTRRISKESIEEIEQHSERLNITHENNGYNNSHLVVIQEHDDTHQIEFKTIPPPKPSTSRKAAAGKYKRYFDQYESSSSYSIKEKFRKGLGDGIYLVDKILEKRIEMDGTSKYLIKWKGYSSAHNTWEPIENLCPLLVEKFENKKSQICQMKIYEEQNTHVTKYLPKLEDKKSLNETTEVVVVAAAAVPAVAVAVVAVVSETPNILIPSTLNLVQNDTNLIESNNTSESVVVMDPCFQNMELEIDDDEKITSPMAKTSDEEIINNKSLELTRSWIENDGQLFDTKTSAGDNLEDGNGNGNEMNTSLNIITTSPLLVKYDSNGFHIMETIDNVAGKVLNQIYGTTRYINENLFLVKFNGMEDYVIVKAELMNEAFPQEVIQYYEKKIIWFSEEELKTTNKHRRKKKI